MIRVTFDRDYIGNLDDYYRRNECIREQQYLSPEKLLHLAAFCISKVAITVSEDGEPRRNGPQAEAALDAVGELALLCERANQADASITPITVVIGQSSIERERHQSHAMSSATPTFVEHGWCSVQAVWAAAGSVVCGVAGWLKFQEKTPRS
jgi:hypothetical protein